MAAPVMTGLRSNWCLQSVHAQTWMKNAAATQIETNSVNFSNIQFIQNGRETSWSPCNHIWLLRAGAAASRDELHGEVVLTSANPTRRPALVGGERLGSLPSCHCREQTWLQIWFRVPEEMSA